MAQIRVLKFGVPFALCVVVLALIGFWAIPATTDWFAWREVQEWVDKSVADVQASPNELKTCKCVNGDWVFVIANHPVEWAGDRGKTMTPPDAEIRYDAFYVLPPGKWASTSDEVVELLRQFKE